jgi:hypothetical protein
MERLYLTDWLNASAKAWPGIARSALAPAALVAPQYCGYGRGYIPHLRVD